MTLYIGEEIIKKRRTMNKYITLESKKKKVVVGMIYAKDLKEAYEQCEWSGKDGNNIIFPESQANQLIIDVNKMLRKKG